MQDRRVQVRAAVSDGSSGAGVTIRLTVRDRAPVTVSTVRSGWSGPANAAVSNRAASPGGSADGPPESAMISTVRPARRARAISSRARSSICDPSRMSSRTAASSVPASRRTSAESRSSRPSPTALRNGSTHPRTRPRRAVSTSRATRNCSPAARA